MQIDPRTIRTIERLLQDELALYGEYLAVMAQEQASVVSLKADLVTELSNRRAIILDRIAESREQRVALLEQLTGDATTRLSDFIEAACAPADKRRLADLVTRIRATSKTVETKSREFNQILNFSLGLVNGELSLLWSASRPVTRVYNAFGSIQEAVQPTEPRAGSLLGEA